MTDCTRWVELFERVETEEGLTPGERRFFVQHGSTCVRCRAEQQALASLRLPVRVDPADDDERLSRAVLAAAASARRPVPSRRLVLAVGAAVALAAAALLVVSALPARPPPMFQVLQVSGAGTLDDAPARAGDALTAGRTLRVQRGEVCLAAATGGTFCLAEGGEATGLQLDGPERTVHLSRGTVRVRMARQPPGIRTGVHTDEGVALAVGTAFDVTRDGETTVHVSEGRVLTRRGGAEVIVEAGTSLVLADPPAPAPALLPPVPGEVPSVDAPVPAPVTPGRTRVVKPPRAEPGRGAPPADRPSASELLRTARALKSEGRGEEAARLYEQLLVHHPGSPEALAGLLALSDLELTVLGQPRKALSHARTYLEARGPLREEALLRELRALKALGRDGEARDKLEALRREFPDRPPLEP